MCGFFLFKFFKFGNKVVLKSDVDFEEFKLVGSKMKLVDKMMFSLVNNLDVVWKENF